LGIVLYFFVNLYVIVHLFHAIFLPPRYFGSFYAERVLVLTLFGTGYILPLLLSRLRAKAIRFNLAVALIVLVLIISIGSTNLVISIAKPLVVSDGLTKADVIIVLGGPFFWSRVEYAVELYRLGYADKLLVMGIGKQGTAVFVQRYSIPPEAITAISRPQSTYDEAIITKRFFEQRYCNKGILVSMPCHMLRAGKTFRNQGLVVSLAPIPSRRWYRYPFRLGSEDKFWLRQIWYRDVIHEYLGLVYYYLKGYI